MSEAGKALSPGSSAPSPCRLQMIQFMRRYSYEENLNICSQLCGYGILPSWILAAHFLFGTSGAREATEDITGGPAQDTPTVFLSKDSSGSGEDPIKEKDGSQETPTAFEGDSTEYCDGGNECNTHERIMRIRLGQVGEQNEPHRNIGRRRVGGKAAVLVPVYSSLWKDKFISPHKPAIPVRMPFPIIVPDISKKIPKGLTPKAPVKMLPTFSPLRHLNKDTEGRLIGYSQPVSTPLRSQGDRNTRKRVENASLLSDLQKNTPGESKVLSLGDTGISEKQPLILFPLSTVDELTRGVESQISLPTYRSSENLILGELGNNKATHKVTHRARNNVELLLRCPGSSDHCSLSSGLGEKDPEDERGVHAVDGNAALNKRVATFEGGTASATVEPDRYQERRGKILTSRTFAKANVGALKGDKATWQNDVTASAAAESASFPDKGRRYESVNGGYENDEELNTPNYAESTGHAGEGAALSTAGGMEGISWENPPLMKQFETLSPAGFLGDVIEQSVDRSEESSDLPSSDQSVERNVIEPDPQSSGRMVQAEPGPFTKSPDPRGQTAAKPEKINENLGGFISSNQSVEPLVAGTDPQSSGSVDPPLPFTHHSNQDVEGSALAERRSEEDVGSSFPEQRVKPIVEIVVPHSNGLPEQREPPLAARSSTSLIAGSLQVGGRRDDTGDFISIDHTAGKFLNKRGSQNSGLMAAESGTEEPAEVAANSPGERRREERFGQYVSSQRSRGTLTKNKAFLKPVDNNDGKHAEKASRVEGASPVVERYTLSARLDESTEREHEAYIRQARSTLRREDDKKTYSETGTPAAVDATSSGAGSSSAGGVRDLRVRDAEETKVPPVASVTHRGQEMRTLLVPKKRYNPNKNPWSVRARAQPSLIFYYPPPKAHEVAQDHLPKLLQGYLPSLSPPPPCYGAGCYRRLAGRYNDVPCAPTETVQPTHPLPPVPAAAVHALPIILVEEPIKKKRNKPLRPARPPRPLKPEEAVKPPTIRYIPISKEYVPLTAWPAAHPANPQLPFHFGGFPFGDPMFDNAIDEEITSYNVPPSYGFGRPSLNELATYPAATHTGTYGSTSRGDMRGTNGSTSGTSFVSPSPTPAAGTSAGTTSAAGNGAASFPSVPDEIL